MKLYATIKNTRGGKKSTGDDTRIIVELTYGNKIVGEVGLYAIIDDKREGYRIIWKDPDTGYSSKNILKEVEKDREKPPLGLEVEVDGYNAGYGKIKRRVHFCHRANEWVIQDKQDDGTWLCLHEEEGKEQKGKICLLCGKRHYNALCDSGMR